MWPFTKKKHVILREEFCESQGAIMDWGVFTIIAFLILVGFASAFVGCHALWTLVPSGAALLVCLKGLGEIKRHRAIVETYREQERLAYLERELQRELQRDLKSNK